MLPIVKSIEEIETIRRTATDKGVVLSCPGCKTRFDAPQAADDGDPVTCLPCGHTVCALCFQAIENSQDGSLRCFVCKKTCTGTQSNAVLSGRRSPVSMHDDVNLKRVISLEVERLLDAASRAKKALDIFSDVQASFVSSTATARSAVLDALGNDIGIIDEFDDCVEKVCKRLECIIDGLEVTQDQFVAFARSLENTPAYVDIVCKFGTLCAHIPSSMDVDIHVGFCVNTWPDNRRVISAVTGLAEVWQKVPFRATCFVAKAGGAIYFALTQVVDACMFDLVIKSLTAEHHIRALQTIKTTTALDCCTDVVGGVWRLVSFAVQNAPINYHLRQCESVLLAIRAVGAIHGWSTDSKGILLLDNYVCRMVCVLDVYKRVSFVTLVLAVFSDVYHGGLFSGFAWETCPQWVSGVQARWFNYALGFMENHSGVESVQCACLTFMLKFPRVHPAFFDNKLLIDVILRGVTAHPAREQVQEFACNVLGRMGRNSLEAVPVIHKAMQNDVGSIRVQIAACDALALHSSYIAQECFDTFCKSATTGCASVHRILATMKANFSGHSALHVAACKALCACISGHPSFWHPFSSRDFACIGQALDCSTAPTHVSAKAAAWLCKLLKTILCMPYKYGCMKKLVVEHGMIYRVVSAMTRYAAYADVQTYGCKLLYVLATECSNHGDHDDAYDEIIRCGGLDVALHARERGMRNGFISLSDCDVVKPEAASSFWRVIETANLCISTLQCEFCNKIP